MLIAVFLFIPETQFPRTSLAQAPSAQLPSRVPQSDKNPKTDVSVTVEDNSVVARKSYLQQLNPWSGINPNGQKASFVSLSLRSWPLIIYPAVAYATVVFGFAVCGILMCIATYSIVFESPPYNMDAGIASLMFLFLAGGAFIGSFYGGLGTDLLSRYLSSKNHGVFEPESRLILLVGPLLLLPSGMIMYSLLILYCALNNDLGTHGVVPIWRHSLWHGSELACVDLVWDRCRQLQWPTVSTALYLAELLSGGLLLPRLV